MRSMKWQIGILGTISAFAYRHRETKKSLCRGGQTCVEVELDGDEGSVSGPGCFTRG